MLRQTVLMGVKGNCVYGKVAPPVGSKRLFGVRPSAFSGVSLIRCAFRIASDKVFHAMSDDILSGSKAVLRASSTSNRRPSMHQ